MRNYPIHAAILMASLSFSGFTYASQPADELLKECQAKAQGAEDSFSAVIKCIDDKLQYDSSGGGD